MPVSGKIVKYIFKEESISDISIFSKNSIGLPIAILEPEDLYCDTSHLLSPEQFEKIQNSGEEIWAYIGGSICVLMCGYCFYFFLKKNEEQ